MQTLPARFAVRAARIKMKIVVLDGDVINPGDISWAPLEKLGEVAIYGDTPEDLIVERAAGAEVLVTNKVPLRSGTLSRLPDLRMVAVLATGYDIIDTAGTLCAGADVLLKYGAKKIIACASHGVLSGPAIDRINATEALDRVIVTDTIPLGEKLAQCPKLQVVSVAALLGKTVGDIVDVEIPRGTLHLRIVDIHR